MTTTAVTPYRCSLPPGRDGFAALLHAEWTKFRTVRGWPIGTAVAMLVTVLIGLLGATGSSMRCSGPHGETCDHTPTLTPAGRPVVDRFSFVHRPLAGDGVITVRVTSLTGTLLDAGAGGGPADGPPSGQDPPHAGNDGLQPWTKAGIIIKESTRAGSPYAAMVVTGGHGVRMQYGYTHDRPGLPGAVSAASPRWLRLSRTGDTIVGYDSTDGVHWNAVGTARLAGLASTVQVGLLVASPEYTVTTRSFGGVSGTGGPTQATASFDRVGLLDPSPPGGTPSGTPSGTPQARTPGSWTGARVGDRPAATSADGVFTQADDAFTVNGSGDISPFVPGRAGASVTIGDSLVGAFAGLVAVTVVATLFMTGEYRRGLIRTTFTASPRRGRVLAAKAIVIAGVTFVAGLIAATVAVRLIQPIERSKGLYVVPVSSTAELRVIVGTAALLAVAAVLALGVGTVLRRGAGAVAAVIVLIVLPYLLAVAPVLPAGPSDWLLRVTPAAAFAIQETVPRYSQVSADYLPSDGFFPLAPGAGFAVLCAYAAAALGLAVIVLRRRDS